LILALLSSGTFFADKADTGPKCGIFASPITHVSGNVVWSAISCSDMAAVGLRSGGLENQEVLIGKIYK
jgi:hypothetical protein